jgi:uncharacterized lipoprotein
MRNNRLFATLPLLVAGLAGCSIIAGDHGPLRNRGNDYLDVQTAAPLAWPEGLNAPAQQELYPVPQPELRRTREEGRVEIPEPPQLVALEDEPATTEAEAAASAIELTSDGNGYPVLMASLSFDWAWQRIGDALRTLSDVEIDDIDRELGVYFLLIDGDEAPSGDPYQLKLNYTANGIQVALQDGEDAMAPREVATDLMQRLDEALR